LPAQASDAGGTYWVGFQGDAYVGEHLSVNDIGRMQVAAGSTGTETPTADYPSLDTSDAATLAGGVITPMSVASGYSLWNPGTRRSSYVYDSSSRGANEAECDSSGCTVINRWETQLHQYVVGNTSKQWQLTLNATRDFGSETPSLTYIYYCAVNVSFAHDHYCSTAQGADPSDETGAISRGGTLYRYFEYGASNTEYPMVDIRVHFAHVTVDTKFRGYDTCVKKTTGTKLCSSSDG
jgi:hypothetical protein